MKAIVVVDKKWGIGKDNNLLFKLPQDLARYKKMTWGKVCVMGAKTYDSLPKVALEGRTNFVLDVDGNFHEKATTVQSLDEFFQKIQQFNTDDVMIIGGATIYKLLIGSCNVAYITKVDADGEATVFFPNVDQMEDWVLQEETAPICDNGYTTRYCTYVKK